jgi:hypothetical protein
MPSRFRDRRGLIEYTSPALCQVGPQVVSFP